MRNGRPKAERVITPDEREQLSVMALAQPASGSGLASPVGLGV